MATLERGMAAGLAGTAAMTAGYRLEHDVLRHHDGPLDYDDSAAPTTAAMRLLRITDLDATDQRRLGLLVHWGYGSFVGTGRVLLGGRLSSRAATATFWAGTMVMAGVLFPLLGGTPPPWRWSRTMLVTSAVQHGVYSVVAGAVADTLRPADDTPGAVPD